MGLFDSMLVGAVEGAAGGRAEDLREQNKQAIAQAREQALAKFQSNLQADRDKTLNAYDVDKQKNQNEFTAGQNATELASREKIAAGNNATTLQAANIGASASRERAAARDPSKDVVGAPVKVMNEAGDPTGQYMVTYRDGSQKVVNPSDVPGAEMSPKDKKDLDKAADTYANDKANDLSSLFTSDKETFKDYGGSKTQAKAAFKQEYLNQQKQQGGAPASDDGTGGAPAVPAASAKPTTAIPEAGATPGLTGAAAQLLQAAKQANPGVSDDQLIQAMKSDPDYAPYFK